MLAMEERCDAAVETTPEKAVSARADSARGELHGHRLAILDVDQCERIAERVHTLRAHWVARAKDAPFFTLGAASYLDGKPGRDEHYRALARTGNPILWDHFKPLYRVFRDALEAYLGETVRYDRSIALPGFHIFLADAVWGRGVASIHADRQYQNVDWSSYGSKEAAEGHRQLSITLSIDLPAAGAGLRLWSVNSLDVPKMSLDERREALAAHRKPSYVPYEKGVAVIHTGHLFHQIAPMPDMRPGEQRLTLQAHALPTRAGWILYW